MFATCLDCTRKHLSTAFTFLNETHLGYPEHRWLAVGELTHASLESAELYPEFSNKIRDVATLPTMNGHESSRKVDVLLLIIEASILADEDDVFHIRQNRSKMYSMDHLTDQAVAVLHRRIAEGDEQCRAWVERVCPQYLPKPPAKSNGNGHVTDDELISVLWGNK